MRRLLVLAMLLALLVGMTSPAAAIAQATTPGPPFGEIVTIHDIDGAPVTAISVNSITDPFLDYEAGNDPEPGYHYVILSVTFFNTTAEPLTVNPNTLRAIDENGVIASSISLPGIGALGMNYLKYGETVQPGQSTTGGIVYPIPDGSTVQRAIYVSGFETRATIVDLRESLTAPGSPVAVTDVSGSLLAQVSVNEVVDPFEGYDQSSAPADGSRYVMIDVTIVNSGQQVLSTSAVDFVAVDDRGFTVPQTQVTPTDPALVTFDGIDIDPGEEQQGVIYYQLFADASMQQITYGDGNTQDMVVADLATGADSLQPAEVGTPAPLAEGDCDGLVEWAAGLQTRIEWVGGAAADLQGVTPNTLDPAAIRIAADQLAVYAQEQRDSNPPPVAQALNTFLVEQFFDPVASAISRFADALEAGDNAAALDAIAELGPPMSLFAPGGELEQFSTDLGAACPAEAESMGMS